MHSKVTPHIPSLLFFFRIFINIDKFIYLDEIEVDLVLPWRYDIQIYYTARSIWPLENSIRTDIRVYKEAPIYFLQELNQLSYNQTSKNVNILRNNLVKRYNDVIQRYKNLFSSFNKIELQNYFFV